MVLLLSVRIVVYEDTTEDLKQFNIMRSGITTFIVSIIGLSIFASPTFGKSFTEIEQEYLGSSINEIKTLYIDPQERFSFRIPLGWVKVGETDTSVAFDTAGSSRSPALEVIYSTLDQSVINKPETQQYKHGELSFEEYTPWLREFVMPKNIDTTKKYHVTEAEFTAVFFDAEHDNMITSDIDMQISNFGLLKQRVVEVLGKNGVLFLNLRANENQYERYTKGLETFTYSVQLDVAPQFEDVPNNNPHALAIHGLRIYGVVDGYDGVNFGPSLPVRRGELLKMILEGVHVDVSQYHVLESPYVDLKKDHSLYPYILYAYQSGIATGYGDGTFRPDDVASNAESIKIILNALEVYATQSPMEINYRLPDSSDLAEYINRAKELNVLYAPSDFQSNAVLYRDYAAETIFRFMWAIQEGVLRYPG